MFERARHGLYALLRVPPTPTPPAGAPGSVRVFRAGRNYFKLKLLAWGAGQAATLFGIVVSLSFLAEVKHEAERVQLDRQASAADAVSNNSTPERPVAPTQRSRWDEKRDEFWRDPQNPLGRIVERTPWWLFPGIALFEFGGILLFLTQLPLTYAMVRLEYESHWYVVTDRSLRIRWGLVTVREATMSFANIQQVTVSQGPLQRLLGIANVRVQSAGGGGSTGNPHEHKDDSMHSGVFHGVDNAVEIRDLILERLRHFRATGLGDPEDHRDSPAALVGALTDPGRAASVVAATRVLEEVRRLKAVFQK
ncbi:MAG TPA: PH domain-containing protein [Opitutus sp.]|nr:PH domain-containing protein [Opitutus sp.]